jgi:Xaa-Pro aminopeptidase
MDAVSRALLEAQNKAAVLFAAIVDEGLIQPGKLESELTEDIHVLARERYDVRRHWHKRIVRAGPNTLVGYNEESADRRIEADDVVFLDLGPVFESWEADFGRTYALGVDPHKHRLVSDIGVAFRRGKELYENTPELTAGELYDYVAGLATSAGWEFGATTAGHLIGHFPHERCPEDPARFKVRSGN